MKDNLLSVGELAQSLNVPKSWLYSRTRQTGADAIPRLKVGKYVRFRFYDVMEWLEGQNKNKD